MTAPLDPSAVFAVFIDRVVGPAAVLGLRTALGESTCQVNAPSYGPRA